MNTKKTLPSPLLKREKGVRNSACGARSKQVLVQVLVGHSFPKLTVTLAGLSAG